MPLSDPRRSLKDRIRDAADRFGEWLDEVFPPPEPEPELVPIPVRRNPPGTRRRRR